MRGVAPLPLGAAGRIEATDYFLFRRVTAGFIIGDAETGHIHAHIRGRVIGTFAPDPLKHGVENGKDLHITVIVDRGFAVGFQMERIDHIYIVQIRRGSFVSQVDGMAQRQIPDGESFKFRISGFHAPLVFVPDLTQAGGHFPAAGAGSRYDHQ